MIGLVLLQPASHCEALFALFVGKLVCSALWAAINKYTHTNAITKDFPVFHGQFGVQPPCTPINAITFLFNAPLGGGASASVATFGFLGFLAAGSRYQAPNPAAGGTEKDTLGRPNKSWMRSRRSYHVVPLALPCR